MFRLFLLPSSVHANWKQTNWNVKYLPAADAAGWVEIILLRSKVHKI